MSSEDPSRNLPPKSIAEMRAVNFTWREPAPKSWASWWKEKTYRRGVYRIEFRREGETEWISIPVIEIEGKPNDGSATP